MLAISWSDLMMTTTPKTTCSPHSTCQYQLHCNPINDYYDDNYGDDYGDDDGDDDGDGDGGDDDDNAEDHQLTTFHMSVSASLQSN